MLTLVICLHVVHSSRFHLLSEHGTQVFEGDGSNIGGDS
jgi:hypothetical protein